MSHSTTTAARWPWAAVGLLLGSGAILAIQHAGRTDAPAQELAPTAAEAAAVPNGGTNARFVAPLERQADTGALDVASAPLPYRTDTFRIALPSGDEAGHEVEQKLRIPAGGAVTFHWSVEGIANPEEFYADLHGHALPGAPFHEASFRQGGGLADGGGFRAPFDGIHGWLFKNDSASPAVVTLEVSGFYEPVSAGELARIEAQIEGQAAQ